MRGLQPIHYKAAAQMGCASPELAIKKVMAARRREFSTVKRAFPKGEKALASTHAYVHAYYALNNLMQITGAEGVDGLFAPLNKAPTTWPTGPDVEVMPDDHTDLINP